ncbi:RNA polymerase sigma factor [Spirosoma sp. BT702]|uniref:RNA polymerase sigma factor n=1 Tax=Spirosoma profusum TaxID=2771354 RepID=A0A927AV74_9BACT|nr:RNA polymerase sigma factor [Spirosoma profusum]MBD2705028.1 RNA polymerase sigma factor [Spirosoma profusum]
MHKRTKYLTDEQLVYRYQRNQLGDSFELLYERYVQKVYQKCLHLTKDHEEAQDFTQDIFLKVFDKLNTFQHRSTFSSWLYAISHNYCLNKLKASRRVLIVSLSDQVREPEPAEEGTDYSFEQRSLILLQVPEADIVVLKLKYEQNLSIREIGERFHASESAIKMRLKRARRKVVQLYYAAHPEGNS